MRVINYLLGFSVLFFSCNSNTQESKIDTQEFTNKDSIIIQDSLSVFADSLSSKDFEIIFDEKKSSLAIKLTKEPKKVITIGTYHNTFNQPPHEIKIEDLGNKNFAIIVFTNQVQLGISEDQINAFCFNLQSKKIVKVCSFDGLGGYSEETGIDTLVGIKLYDYKLTKVNEKGVIKLEVMDFKPFKYKDEAQNKGLNINTIKKECVFSLSIEK